MIFIKNKSISNTNFKIIIHNRSFLNIFYLSFYYLKLIFPVIKNNNSYKIIVIPADILHNYINIVYSFIILYYL